MISDGDFAFLNCTSAEYAATIKIVTVDFNSTACNNSDEDILNEVFNLCHNKVKCGFELVDLIKDHNSTCPSNESTAQLGIAYHCSRKYINTSLIWKVLVHTTSLPAPFYFIYVPVLRQYRKRHAWVNLAFIPVFKAHTHKLYILRHFTDIVSLYRSNSSLIFNSCIFSFYNNVLSYIGNLQPSEVLVKQSAEKQTILTGTDYLSRALKITFGS